MADYIDSFGWIMGSVQMLAGFHFLASFLKRKLKLVCYCFFFVLEIVIMSAVGSNETAEFFVYILMLLAGGLFLCRADKVVVILYTVLIIEIMQLSYGIFNSISCILYPLIFNYNQKITGILFMILLEGAALSAAALYCHIIYQYISSVEIIKKQHIIIVLIPILMMFFIGEYINAAVYGNTIVTDNKGNIVNVANQYQMLAIQLLGMASLLCIMWVYKNLTDNSHLSTELTLLEQKERFMNQYVKEVKMRYERTKSFRHDIKNHIVVVKELLQKEKIEQARKYIEDIEDITETLSFPCSTNNPAADIVIGNKFGTAKSEGIEVRCSFILPFPCLVRDIDICTILSNALDNAIHACQDMEAEAEKYIHLSGNVQGSFIMLRIENSMNSSLSKTKGKGVLKKGIGLSNIRAVVKKYHGTMNIKTEGSVFLLSILLIIPQHPESISQQIR